MTDAVPMAVAISNVLDRVLRDDRGRLLAALAAGLRDLSLAEESLQEAAISALSHWGRSGVPDSPEGWLLKVARRKAIDRLRGATRDRRKAEVFADLLRGEESGARDEFTDERLRLIFVRCHLALEPKSRVALTLRTVCGLSTSEIARSFLDQEATMGQRLSRAKAKIVDAGIPFRVPESDDWAARLDAVLTTISLVFTVGYAAAPGEPRDLCLEAEYLARLLAQLRPDDAEIEGALAMILLTAARRAARVGKDGASVPPAEQDRALWDAQRLAEGRALLARAVSRRTPGPFQIKAAIADCHCAAEGPDWQQIALLYRSLYRFEPTPIVSLNMAVAVAEAGELAQGLSMVEALAEELGDYQPWHAARELVHEGPPAWGRRRPRCGMRRRSPCLGRPPRLARSAPLSKIATELHLCDGARAQ
jgi:RNA polymerase sigma factor (sigma-70 family)